MGESLGIAVTSLHTFIYILGVGSVILSESDSFAGGTIESVAPHISGT